MSFEKANVLIVALVLFSKVDFKVVVNMRMGFEGNYYIFNLETKNVLLVASLFDLKVDFGVFNIKNGFLGLEFSL